MNHQPFITLVDQILAAKQKDPQTGRGAKGILLKHSEIVIRKSQYIASVTNSFSTHHTPSVKLSGRF